MVVPGEAEAARVSACSSPACRPFSRSAGPSCARAIGPGAGCPCGKSRLRNSSATSSSTELECVFFSCTPSSGSMSMITPGFTSSSRASSLILIFFIESTASTSSPRARDRGNQACRASARRSVPLSSAREPSEEGPTGIRNSCCSRASCPINPSNTYVFG